MNQTGEIKIENNLLDKFLNKRKYLEAPTIYKILYDKYQRGDIHNFISNKKISEIYFEDFKRDPKFLTFPLDSYDKDSYKTENFSEFLILTYYDHLHKEKVFAYLMTFFTIFQYGVFKMFQKIKWENKKFIFLDNNRIIMNKICTFNVVLFNLMKFNLFVFGGISVYSFFKYLSDKYGNNLREIEREVEQKYKRSILLYSKLKI